MGVLSSNQHEHLHGFVPTECLFAAYREQAGEEPGEIPLGEIAGKNGEDRAHKALEAVFGPEAPGLLPPAVGDLPLGDIARRLGERWGEPPESLLAHFFRFGPRSRRGVANYRFNEDFRKHVFKGLFRRDRERYHRFLEAAFRHALDRMGLRGGFVAFSVPGELFQEEGLRRIRRIFAGRQIEVEFYFSYPRYKLGEERAAFDRKLALVASALAGGWGEGIDVTGSIDESDADDGSDGLYRDRLGAMASLFSGGGLWKLHAFEGARRGPFYDALWASLEGDLAAVHTAIGHINRLEEADIRRFELLRDRGRRFSFDANVPSNSSLHGTPEKRLLATLTRLLDAGFEVGVGGDGQGILGHSPEEGLRAFLNRHLPRVEADRIADRLVGFSRRPRAGNPR